MATGTGEASEAVGTRRPDRAEAVPWTPRSRWQRAGRTGPDRRAAWEELATPGPVVARFDPDDVADLPGPARRLLLAALEPGVALGRTVVLDMRGRIRLGRWLPFRARQVLRVGSGLVWQARVGPGPVRITGADVLWRGRGGLDFRLWGLVPVASADGADVDRSAIGRLAAETVAWAPQGLTPALGATWREVDADRAIVTLPIEGDFVDVTVTVDAVGRLEELCLQRWGDPDGSGESGLHAFGGEFTHHLGFDGVTVASGGRVGWHWEGPRRDAGTFFDFTVIDAHFPRLGIAPD